MRWRSKLGVTLAALSALGACGRSRQAVNGGSGGHAAAGATGGGGGSAAGGDGGAPDPGAPGGASASAGTTSNAGLGASAGRSSDAGAPDRDDQNPPAFVPSCLQPKPPAGDLEPPTEVHVGSTWLRSSERNCTWTTGEPLALPLEPDDPTELLFQFDLNGDHVDELIFGDHALGSIPASGRSLVVLESHLDDGELTYERSSCDSPWDTSYRSFYARDLDRDGQLDFVIGRNNGVSALLNRGGERPEVLHYEWPSGTSVDAWASILDVAVGDFDADGRDDIAIGYDRATGVSTYAIETGVILFRERSAQGTYGPPEEIARASLDVSSPLNVASVPAGLLASLARTGGASALVSLYLTGETPFTGLVYENQTRTTFLAPTVTSYLLNFARGAELGGQSALWIGDRDQLEVVRPSEPYEHLASIPMAYTHAGDHELGGGTRVRSLFLLDLDGDGDEDLVESGSKDGWAPYALWTHNRISESEFAGSTLAQASTEASRFAESPFVHAGVMPGRLFVSQGSSAPTPALVPLVCNSK